MRKYGFKSDEIPVESSGNLSLEIDPKEMWARMHPDFFPVNVNRDDKYRLLRVPGLGQVMVDWILGLRGRGKGSHFGRFGKTNQTAQKSARLHYVLDLKDRLR